MRFYRQSYSDHYIYIYIIIYCYNAQAGRMRMEENVISL